ncbi:tyrosyl-DNA phosphodiesterase domain protein, partial [Diplocarpon rosae]
HGAKPNAVPSVAPGLLGMDRKAMEAERLRRLEQRRESGQLESNRLQRKRQASTSPARLGDHERPRVRPKLSDAKELGSIRTSNKIHNTGERGKSELLSRNQQQSLLAPGIQYPHGVVMKTWVHGVPRQGDDIRIEEVLQSDDLELAVLSAFQIEPAWVESKLRPQTKVVWVLQAKGEAERGKIRSDAPANYRFCFPNMEGNINCMHSKLQLLAHPTHIRIVIPSANLTSYDWGETGIMENICFLIDLPRLPPGQKTELTDFASELFRFTGAMGLEQKIVKSLHNFDFSHTASMAFVHSIGGSHLGSARERTGYCGLGRAVTNLGLATDEPLRIDFLSASIGSINDDFLKCLYLASQGDLGMTEYGWRANKPLKAQKMTAIEQKISDGLKDCRIYFPARETVTESKGGVGGGGTICFQSRWYDSDVFPRHLMRDCKSRRPGLLMHSKMIFVRTKSSKQARWAYVGSANLSESAW